MKNINKIILLLIFNSAFLFFNSFSQTAPGIEWQNTIGGNSYDALSAISQTADKGYICGGTSSSDSSGDKTENSWNSSTDYWVIKLDSTGNIQWQNTIGGSDNDYLLSVSQTLDGGYICGGASSSNISGDKTEDSWFFSSDYWVVKLDSAGNIQWQNTIGGTANDGLNSIFQTTDGGYICGGSSISNISGDKTENNLGLNDYWVIKLDSSGGIQWQNTIGGSSNDDLYSISQTTDGGYICGGWSNSNISVDKTENNWDTSLFTPDYWVLKLDSSGNIQWQNTIGGNDIDRLYSISQTSDRGYILGGISFSDSSGDKTENNLDTVLNTYDYWIIKLDSSGNIQWQNTIGGNSDDWLFSISQTFDGGYVCGGWSNSNISGDKTENSQGGRDYWVVKLDSSGNILWQNSFGGNNTDELHSMSQISDGGYICGGWSKSNISGDKTENNWDPTLVSYDYWIVKLYPDTITGIPNLQSSTFNFQFFPNPFTNNLNVEANNNELSEITLYDITSRKLLQQKFINSVSLNTEQLTKGIYIYEVRNKDGSCKKGKVVKD